MSSVTLTSLREAYLQGRCDLRKRYADPLRALPVLSKLTHLTDVTLHRLWLLHNLPDDVLLIAVGGYGRREQFPFSDVDILILVPEEADAARDAHIESLVGQLWDIGMEIGHSVRTLTECLNEAAGDTTIQTALLENRLLEGRPARYAQFRSALYAQIDPLVFFNAKVVELQARHGKFENATYKLEPNIKDAPGGLRDLQQISWIIQSLGLGKNWRCLGRLGLMSQQGHRKLRWAERVLKLIRIELHWQANRHEDRILFDYQHPLAERFGLKDQGQGSLFLQASEALMAEYYLAARTVTQLAPLQVQTLHAQIVSPIGIPIVAINERFQLRGNQIEITQPNVFEQHPSAILELFLLCERQREVVDIAPDTLRALWLARSQINAEFRANPKHQALFIALFREPRGLTWVLRKMNQYGILGRYIEEFGHIVGRMQHDLFHVYTVDEHTLMVFRNLRRFANPVYTHEYPLCSRLIAELERPEALYLAALFHDIGKGRGGDHSHIGASLAAPWVAEHPLPQEDRDLIVWLVTQHLTMSHTAQKEDVYDPEVVARFALLVETPRRLAALYLLTVADIRGTSPQVWNAWKAKLLEDLFKATQRQLNSSGHNITVTSWVDARQEEALRLLRLYGFRPEAHEAFWRELDMVYFLRNDARDIAWQTRMLYARVNSDETIVRVRLSESGEGLQVMVYTRDEADLFARICSFFEVAGYSILDAQIHTTRHNYALDSFYVHNADNQPNSYRDLISYVEYELAHQISEHTSLQTPRATRISRQLKHFPLEPQVIIRPDERGKTFILTVSAGDRPGLLSTIAKILSTHNIEIHSAKIMTLGARAEDNFVIAGSALYDEKVVQQLEGYLLQALRS